MTPRSRHFSSWLSAKLQSHHLAMLHPSATLHPSAMLHPLQCFRRRCTTTKSISLLFSLFILSAVLFFFFFCIYLLIGFFLFFWGLEVFFSYPFKLGFLEFLYLAAFHGSLTIWLFRKKKKKWCSIHYFKLLVHGLWDVPIFQLMHHIGNGKRVKGKSDQSIWDMENGFIFIIWIV